MGKIVEPDFGTIVRWFIGHVERAPEVMADLLTWAMRAEYDLKHIAQSGGWATNLEASLEAFVEALRDHLSPEGMEALESLAGPNAREPARPEPTEPLKSSHGQGEGREETPYVDGGRTIRVHLSGAVMVPGSLSWEGLKIDFEDILKAVSKQINIGDFGGSWTVTLVEEV